MPYMFVKNPYTAYVMSNKHLFEKIVVTLQLSVAKIELAIPMFLVIPDFTLPSNFQKRP